jgi:hypothetical protein
MNRERSDQTSISLAGVRPGSAELLARQDLYLCNIKNRRFLEGNTRKLAGGKPEVAYILFSAALSLFVIIPLLFGSDGLVVLLLQISHRSTEGTVIDTRTAEERGEHGGTTRTYYVRYSFAANGQAYSAESEVEEAVYERYEPGSHVTIAYFPGYPHISHISPFSWTVSVFFTVLALVISGFAVPLYLYKGYCRRRLSKNGQLLLGELTHWYVEEKSNRSRSFTRKVIDLFDERRNSIFSRSGEVTRKVIVKYTFKNPDGRAVYGEKHFGSGKEPAFIGERGDPVAVLYLNDNRFDVL